MEQNPEQGEEEEEAVERGSVGRMRGTEMVHNKLSRVFSCSPLYFLHFFWFDRLIHSHHPSPCLPGSLAIIGFLFSFIFFKKIFSLKCLILLHKRMCFFLSFRDKSSKLVFSSRCFIFFRERLYSYRNTFFLYNCKKKEIITIKLIMSLFLFCFFSLGNSQNNTVVVKPVFSASWLSNTPPGSAQAILFHTYQLLASHLFSHI